jgi:serine/threonine protein phosphatase PrpC
MAEPPAQPKPRLTFGQRSDVGMVRGNNQDSAFSIVFADDSSNIAADFGLFIVADGMGGHHDGERASRLTTRLVSYQAMNLLHEILLTNDSVFDETVLLDKLAEAIRQARNEVNEKGLWGESTCTLTVILNNKIYIAHVGDCRVYLLALNQITRLTEDIPLVEERFRLDNSDEDAPPKPLALSNPIGRYEPLIKTYTRPLPPSSSLLLCSDGLWREVKEQEMLELFQDGEAPQKVCDTLVALANSRVGADNITAIVVQIP